MKSPIVYRVTFEAFQARFNELVERAERGQVIEITREGKPTLLMKIDYRKEILKMLERVPEEALPTLLKVVQSFIETDSDSECNVDK